MRARFERVMGVYLIVEPPIQAVGQVSAGIVALALGDILLGVGILVWTMADIFAHAYAGVNLFHHQHHHQEGE